MMAPWDSKIRWQLGGNFQRVRLICAINWQECPLAIADHIWSEIVTDVIECITNEGILLRLIILILVCTIFFHAIWTRGQWITECIVSKDSLNRVDIKIQDLELRINVLTYKMQYGTWPLPQQINGTHIDDNKNNLQLSLSNSKSCHASYMNCYDENLHIKNRFISKSENFGLRMIKQNNLVDVSRKIHCNRPNEMYELKLFNDTSDSHEKCDNYDNVKIEPIKYTDIVNNDDKFHGIKEIKGCTKRIKSRKSTVKKRENKTNSRSKNRNLSGSNKIHVLSKSIDYNIPIAPIDDNSNDNTPMSIKRTNSTQETVANVKERLESLHTILKTYVMHDLKLNNGDNIKCEMTSVNLNESHTVNKKINDEKCTDEFNENETIDEIIDDKNNYKIQNDNGKIPMFNDTDDDLNSVSSQHNQQKESSDSDKSTNSTDALMLNNLLNHINFNNLKCDNIFNIENTNNDCEYNARNVFPKLDNFCQSKLLDIISEEQSGSSCTEKTSKTIIYTKLSSDKNVSLHNSPVKLNKEIFIDTNKLSDNIHQQITDNNTNVELKMEMHNDTEQKLKKCPIELNEIRELNEITSQPGGKLAINDIKCINSCEKLTVCSSDDSVVNIIPDGINCNWKINSVNNASISENINKSNNLFDIDNVEQLIDVSNHHTLKRIPGVFSINKSTNNLQCDNYDSDLIDLNFNDNEIIIANKETNLNNEFNIPLNITHITDNILNTESIKCLGDNVPLSNQNAIFSLDVNDNKESTDDSNQIAWNNHDNNDTELNNIYGNTGSCDLLELERITYDNSWSNGWTLKNNCDKILVSDDEIQDDEDKKSQLYSQKSSLILSSPSSVYLTVDGSFSSITTDNNQYVQSIEKIEWPEEIENIDNIVNDNVVRNSESFDCESIACKNYDIKSSHGLINKLNNEIHNDDNENSVNNKSSTLNENPRPTSIIDVDTTNTNTDIYSININNEISSYVDGNNHNLICQNEIKLPLDESKIRQSLDKSGVIPSKKSLTNANANTIKTSKIKNTMKKVESKTMNATKINNNEQIMSKAKSILNLTRENSMNLQIDKSNDSNEFGKHRSKSYIAPRKREVSPRYLYSAQDSRKIQRQNSKIKLNNSDVNTTNSKNNLIIKRSNSYMRFNQTNSLSKSQESVNTTMSKSCIPVLKTLRLNTTKNIDSRPRSPLRGPLTMSIDSEHNSIEINTIERSLCTNKNDNGDNKTIIDHDNNNNLEDKKEQLIIAEGQTVIYVNIVTDHDNCVTKVVDPKKFLECVKDKDLNIQEIINDNYNDNRNENNDNDCINNKIVTVISSTGGNPMSFNRQREIEVLAKPSVIDISTSISDLPKNNSQLKQLRNNECIALLNTLENQLNFHEFQKI